MGDQGLVNAVWFWFSVLSVYRLPIRSLLAWPRDSSLHLIFWYDTVWYLERLTCDCATTYALTIRDTVST